MPPMIIAQAIGATVSSSSSPTFFAIRPPITRDDERPAQLEQIVAIDRILQIDR